MRVDPIILWSTFLLATGFIAVAYLLLARGLYYPWYAILPIALLALTPTLRSIATVISISPN